MAEKSHKAPTVIGRWLQGRAHAVGIAAAWYGGALLVLLLGGWALNPVVRPLLTLGPPLGQLVGVGGPLAGAHILQVVLPVGFVWWFFGWVGSDHYRATSARWTAPLRRHNTMAGMGRGGSARFGGVLDEWDTPHAPGGVLLGRSLFDGRAVGLSDDRGLLTIASNRSGKGRAGIIPNLLLWEGSAVIIDPKGTNAAVTAARRGKGGGRVTESLGQPVHVLDPFGIVAGVKSAAFNPLDAVDPLGLTAKEDIDLIADALVVPSGPGESHWDEGARLIVGGIIAHLLTRVALRKPSLLDMRAALRAGPDDMAVMLAEMSTKPVAGGMAQAAANMLLAAGPNERGSLLTTALRNTAWLDSLAMSPVLASSSFTMSDLKEKPTTVYVVLPPHMLAEHSRFMRLFVNMTVQGASRGGKSRVPILLVMDEFYALGSLSSLAKASGALAGYGLKLWPILQNLSQLRELYPENWQTFFANAAAVQIFGVNDRGTAQEVVATLGQAARLERIEGRNMRVVSNMLESDELDRLTERDSGLMLVLRSGKRPLLLKKTPYDSDPLFRRSMYGPDPDHKDS